MMALNGSDTPNLTAWSQTLPVTPGSTYNFSFFGATLYPLSVATLKVSFNGTSLGTFTMPSSAGAWQNYTAPWNSGTSSTLTITIVDTNTDASGNNFAIDDLSLSGTAPIQADPTNASPIHFTAVFSEAVTGFGVGGVTLGGSAHPSSDTVTGSGTTYDVAVSGMTSNGTVSVSVKAGAAQDAAGNLSTTSTSIDNTVTYDTTPPTVTINQASTQADPAMSSPIHFTAVFNKPVTGFSASGVLLGGTANPSSDTVTGSGTTYDVAASGMTNDGTVTATVLAGAAHDAANNLNLASTSTDDTVTLNTEIFDPADGHYYKLVTTTQSVTWPQAEADAAALTFNGLTGYLATVTTAAENSPFITSTFNFSVIPGGVLIGGFQPPGSPEPAGGWQWITGEPFIYTNWG